MNVQNRLRTVNETLLQSVDATEITTATLNGIHQEVWHFRPSGLFVKDIAGDWAVAGHMNWKDSPSGSPHFATELERMYTLANHLDHVSRADRVLHIKSDNETVECFGAAGASYLPDGMHTIVCVSRDKEKSPTALYLGCMTPCAQFSRTSSKRLRDLLDCFAQCYQRSQRVLYRQNVLGNDGFNLGS